MHDTNCMREVDDVVVGSFLNVDFVGRVGRDDSLVESLADDKAYIPSRTAGIAVILEPARRISKRIFGLASADTAIAVNISWPYASGTCPASGARPQF